MAVSPQQSQVEAQKFQFDDFEGEDLPDRHGGLTIAEIPEVTYRQEELDAAKRAAEAEGYERGREAANASTEGDIQRLMAQIAQAADTAVSEQRTICETIGSESVRLAALIARKVLPAMAEAGALQEIEALIARCLGDRPEESRLVIRLHDSMLDKVEARISKITTETGFAGKPILLADPSLTKSEVRIEWANGGVDWSFAKQLGDIEIVCQRLAVKPGKVKAYTTPIAAAHDDSPMSEIMDEAEPSPPTDSGE